MLPPDGLLVGRWICDDGRGIGTPFPAGMGTLCVCLDEAEGSARVDVDGDDGALDQGRRCVGCEYGSNEDSPIK